MRAGATLVAEVFGSGPAAIDDLVLWDPCASGRAFLREQRSLWSIALGARLNDDGAIETPGLVYDRDTVAGLSALEIASGNGPLANGVLVLGRANIKGDQRMMQRLSMPHVERVAVVGQERLVAVQPYEATVPHETIETIVEWLSSRAAAAPTAAIDLNAAGRNRAFVGTAPNGASIHEQQLSLGPIGLFGIMTARQDRNRITLGRNVRPADKGVSATWADAPTIFLLNAGVIGHAGPARLWVELSRLWAASGFSVVRFDLSGLGDSPVHAGQPSQVAYSEEGLGDLQDVLRDILPNDPSNSVLVGLCSGANFAILTAIECGVRGVCAVNPPASISRPEMHNNMPSKVQTNTLSVRRQLPGVTKRARALLVHEPFYPVLEGLPSAAWWFVKRFGLNTLPMHTLSMTLGAGVNVLVIAGRDETRRLTRGERFTMHRLRRNARFHMQEIPDLEHSLFEYRTRDVVAKLLTEHVLGNYSPSVEIT
jgi:pimeloyl-ACP methyl ester carboxylesterase